MKNFLLMVFMAGALGASAVMVYSMHAFNAPGPLTASKIIVLAKGSGVLGMAATLEQENIISNKYVFAAFARLTQTYKSLKAGEYEFTASMPMNAVLAKVASGDIYKRNFTIPEGKTSFEIVQILNSVPNLMGEVMTIPQEGSLLPETYSYLSGESRAEKIKMMQDKMQKTIEALWPTRDGDLPFTTQEEAITLASIVEKETGVASERQRVAGVFINRLRTGMLLQSDPTVIYGITKGENKNEGQGPLGRRLLSADLQTPNPYNTYMNPGLPPGPIANPGKASIEAVLHPEKNNFLFFVADGKGGHVFASTLDEHNRNVAQWREMRKEKND